MILSNSIRWFKIAFAVAAIGSVHSSVKAEGVYDPKSKILSHAPILIEGVRGEVRASDLNGTNQTTLNNGMKVRQGTLIEVGRNSRVDLIFSNGTVLALDAGAKLSINQFLQAGGFDIASPIRDSKAVIDHTIPSIGQIDKEPSYSFTKLYLHEGTMYARVKKLHKKSKYEVATALGKSKILGTTWRETVGIDRENLKKNVEILLQEGLIQFKPIDSGGKVHEAITIRPEEKVSISGTFRSLESMNLAMDVTTNLSVRVDIAVDREWIRDQEFAGLISGYLPLDRNEQIFLQDSASIPNETSDDSAVFGGDQGVGTVGAMVGGFGGSGGGNGTGGNSVPASPDLPPSS